MTRRTWSGLVLAAACVAALQAHAAQTSAVIQARTDARALAPGDTSTGAAAAARPSAATVGASASDATQAAPPSASTAPASPVAAPQTEGASPPAVDPAPTTTAPAVTTSTPLAAQGSAPSGASTPLPCNDSKRLTPCIELRGEEITGELRKPGTPDPRKPRHVLTAYAQLGALAYLSRYQTAGGAGGGLGIRDTIVGRCVLQADLHHLLEIGNAFALRLGAGMQRQAWNDDGTPRVWTPGFVFTGTVHFGDRLRFLTADHPTPVVAPPIALGIAAAPLRFQTAHAEVSLLEVGAGLGWDFPGLGTAVNVSLIEVGAKF